MSGHKDQQAVRSDGNRRGRRESISTPLRYSAFSAPSAVNCSPVRSFFPRGLRGINGLVSPRDDADRHPPVPCWFCKRRIPIDLVLRTGILLGREAARGGPQRLLICPSCLKENLCEVTRGGRWFASPRTTVSLLDVLFSRLSGPEAAEEVLQAISWYRENEDRRRIYFERDGDDRYSGGAKTFLRRLWPWSTDAEKEPRPPPGAERGPGRARTGAGKAQEGSRGRDGAGSQRTRPPPRSDRPAIVTPFEILGLGPDASAEDVRKAFHRLAVQYHPDKVHHLGEEFRAMAHVKFQELKRAYDALMERR